MSVTATAGAITVPETAAEVIASWALSNQITFTAGVPLTRDELVSYDERSRRRLEYTCCFNPSLLPPLPAGDV